LFLYFSEKSEPLETIRPTVMWDVLAGQLPLMATETGPTGKAGHILAGPGQHRVHGYSKAEQEWVNCGDYWLGWDKNGLPTPEQLQRKKVVAGEVATLADGREWVCPTVRRWEGGNPFPGVPYVVQMFTDYQIDVLPQYMDVWQFSGDAWDDVIYGKNFKVVDSFQRAAKFLSVNYRVGVHECSALKIMDMDSINTITLTALDMARFEEFATQIVKKNEAVS
jgi:hypothetical protein